jgi:hypothetical protein
MQTEKKVRDKDDVAIQQAVEERAQSKLNTHNKQLKETSQEAEIHKMIKDALKILTDMVCPARHQP